MLCYASDCAGNAAVFLFAFCHSWVWNRFAQMTHLEESTKQCPLSRCLGCWLWQLWSALFSRVAWRCLVVQNSWSVVTTQTSSSDTHHGWPGLQSRMDSCSLDFRSWKKMHRKCLPFLVSDKLVCCKGFGLWRKGSRRPVLHLLLNPRPSGPGAILACFTQSVRKGLPHIF